MLNYMFSSSLGISSWEPFGERTLDFVTLIHTQLYAQIDPEYTTANKFDSLVSENLKIPTEIIKKVLPFCEFTHI